MVHTNKIKFKSLWEFTKKNKKQKEIKKASERTERVFNNYLFVDQLRHTKNFAKKEKINKIREILTHILFFLEK